MDDRDRYRRGQPLVRVGHLAGIECKLFELDAPLTYSDPLSKVPPYTEDAELLVLDAETGEIAAEPNGQLEKLYYSGALIDAEDNYIGLPRLRAGMRVWAWQDRTDGRWEIVPHELQMSWRGTLDEELVQGGSADVSITIVGGDPGVTVTAYDNLLGVSESIPATTKVFVTWFADDGYFYTTGAACGVISE